VSIPEDRLVAQQSIDAGTEGHVPILDQEFEDIEAFLLESSAWLDAMRKRGLNPRDIRAVPLSAGVFGHEDEVGRRVVRVLAFYQCDDADLPWAHPVDGVVAYVDLTTRRVTKVIDEFDLAVPAERGGVGRRTPCRARAYRFEAHRDHSARRPELLG
jgi:primary-amine oxidase